MRQPAATTEAAVADPKQPPAGLLYVKIYTPFKTFFDGFAHSVSADNQTGRFDVLAGHHNFITVLKPCDVVVVEPDQSSRTINVKQGLVHVRDDQLVIFMDI